MKKIYLLIGFLLLSLTAISQVPARHTNGVKTKYVSYLLLTTAQRDALSLGANDRLVLFNTTDSEYQEWNGTAWGPFLGFTNNIYEDELTDAENNINVGFTLLSTTLVYFNGKLIPNALWSGEGTSTLNLSLATKIHDNLIVKN